MKVKYTLNSLINAMIELLEKEHISKISVVSLCKIADVNRSTFYTHFENQYHLLNYITQEALNNIQIYLQEFRSFILWNKWLLIKDRKKVYYE